MAGTPLARAVGARQTGDSQMPATGPATPPVPTPEQALAALASARRLFAGMVPMFLARDWPRDLARGEVRVVITDGMNQPCGVWVLAPHRHTTALVQVSPAEAERQLRLWLRHRRDHEVFARLPVVE